MDVNARQEGGGAKEEASVSPHIASIKTIIENPRIKLLISPSQLVRIDKLGRGAFAEVELAWFNGGDPTIKKKVAVKRYHPLVLRDEQCLRLLSNEVDILSRIQHK